MNTVLETEKVEARPQSRCIVCGQDNPRGLQVRFVTVPDGRVAATWSPTEDWEGFQGVLHGGIISTLLDEAMSKAVVAHDWRALTCELRVRYKRRIGTGEQLRLEGWVVERRKRRIVTEASLLAEDGVERAHAWGTFLAVD